MHNETAFFEGKFFIPINNYLSDGISENQNFNLGNCCNYCKSSSIDQIMLAILVTY